MIKRFCLLAFGILGMAAHGISAENPDLYTSAQRDYLAGRLDAAKAKFEQMLAADPNDTRAQKYLKMIEAAPRKPGASSLEKKLSGVVLPRVEFKDATFSSCIEFIRQEVEKQTDGEFRPNFVLNIPNEKAEHAITLSLRNIPAREVLRYLGDLASLRFSFQEHAIVVTPVPAGASTPAE
jgi:hypothetical protein